MIDPSIALNVRNPQLKSPTESYSDLMTLRSMQNQGELQGLQVSQAKNQMADYERNAPTRKLTEFNEREQARFQSILPAAMQTVTYLNNNDVPGAANFLTQRLETLKASGIDSKDIEEALQALMRDPNSLLQASMGMIDVGRQMGLVQGSANEGFTLSPGQQRFDAMGNPIASVEDAPKMTSSMQEYNLAREQGYGGTFQQYETDMKQAGAPRTSIDMGNRGPQVGTIPAGFQLLQGEDGGWMMQPVPGGPADREAQETAEQAAMRQNQRGRYSDVVTEDIDRALDIVNTAKMPVTGFGSLLSSVPGTPQRDLLGLVDTIRANVGFDRLQAMREASPTGGALGAVSDLENRLLQATLGNLELSQSKDQFVRNLERVRDIYNQIVNEGISPEKAEELISQSSTIKAGTVEDGYVFKGGDPSDPKNWKKQ